MATGINGNYRDLSNYKSADSATRLRLERWKREQHIDDTQMYLLLSQQLLLDLPPEKKKEARRAGENMAFFAVLFFLMMMATRQRSAMLVASVVVIFSTVMYVGGFADPVRIRLRKLRKALKKYPRVETFAAWCAAHPEPSAQGGEAQNAPEGGTP